MSELLDELMAKRAACTARIKELEEKRQKALNIIERIEDELANVSTKEELIAKLTEMDFTPEQIEEAARMFDVLKECTDDELEAMLKPPV